MVPERIQISERISYWKATEEPLSADIGVVTGDKYIWVFDAGDGEEVLRCVCSLEAPVNLVLSHFHKDHIGNVGKMNYSNLYQGAHTLKYTHAGEVIRGDMWIEDGVTIHLFEIPSGHAKGCIGMEVGDYAFLGDAIYCVIKDGKPVYNANLLGEQIKVLRALQAKYFLLSHRERVACKKEVVLRQLESIYAKRDSQSAWIFVEE